MEIDPRLRPVDAQPQAQATEYPDPPRSYASSQQGATQGQGQTGPGQVQPGQGGYTPYTPQAAPTATPTGLAAVPGANYNPQHTSDDLKRQRACEACRTLKVRCDPDPHPTNPGPCKRCAKAGRECVVTVPSRKRAKKTDGSHRVAELERKVDALTASLQARGGEVPGEGPAMATAAGMEMGSEVGGGREPRRWLGGGGGGHGSNGAMSPGSMAGRKRGSTGEVKSPNPGKAMRMEAVMSEEADAIDRGVVDVDAAQAAFSRYVNEMAPQMPVVVFPAYTPMQDIRREKPILFHAILTIAIDPIQPAAQAPLLNELYKIIAERTLIKGEKSLELVQVILVTCLWYIPPDHFEELKFYQLSHLAVIMGMDLGMNRRTLTGHQPFSLVRDIMGRKKTSIEPNSPETRRTWLGCYFMAVQVSTALRRVLLVRWQPYMDECLEILQNSAESLPSDKTLIHWVKLAHLTEEIAFQFSIEDPGSTTSFTDPKVQNTLKAFEQQLWQWKREIPPESYTPIMRQSEHITNTYMHEVAMHMNCGSQPASEDLSPTSAALITALTSCLSSIQQSLEIISAMDARSILCLPTIFVARTSYAVVALIKLYSLVSAPDSKIGQVIDPASLKVEYYLDKVIDRYNTAGEHEGGRKPAKFAGILALLRNWFVRRKDQTPALREAFEECKPGERPEPPKITTPLHLLSEVAMDPNRSHTTPSQTYRVYPEGQAQEMPIPTDSDQWTYPPPPGSLPQAQAQRPFYPSYNQYPDLNATNTPYDPNIAGAGAGLVPELGMQVGLEPENLFALGNMLDEGVFNLPFVVDGSFY